MELIKGKDLFTRLIDYNKQLDEDQIKEIFLSAIKSVK